VNWDLSNSDKPSDLVARPCCELRPRSPRMPARRAGFSIFAKASSFHDGSEFTAESVVVWNFDKLLTNGGAAVRTSAQSAQGRLAHSFGCHLQGDRQIHTRDRPPRTPDATLPYQLAWFMISSAGAVGESSARAGTAFAKEPSGTGPWKLTLVRAARARRDGSEPGLLGQAAGVPKLDKLVPAAAAGKRTLASPRSAPVKWTGIEAPAARWQPTR